MKLFVRFLLVIVLSVLLRFADSDYPFCIFKLVVTSSKLLDGRFKKGLKRPKWWQIINGEIKQTQLGITCIASIQYHTQYISINIHSTKYQHNYKISIFSMKIRIGRNGLEKFDVEQHWDLDNTVILWHSAWHVNVSVPSQGH
jgi:hypothetical protein